MYAGHSGRCRHAARGADTSVGGWQVAGVGKVQVGNVTHQDRRWGVGVTEREVI